MPYSSYEKKEEENPGNRRAPYEIWRLYRLICLTWFGRIFPFVCRESDKRSLHVFLRDAENKAIPCPTQAGGKALGKESKLPLLRQVVVTRNPQRNF
jgi:hypothetical protein